MELEHYAMSLTRIDCNIADAKKNDFVLHGITSDLETYSIKWEFLFRGNAIVSRHFLEKDRHNNKQTWVECKSLDSEIQNEIEVFAIKVWRKKRMRTLLK
jgi:hypothetical protein